MSGPRQPTDILVMNGRKHLTRSEEDARRDAEVHIPVPEFVTPPKWLLKRFHKEFCEIGDMLRMAGLYSDLDRDVLAQFLVCKDHWINADKQAAKAIANKDDKLAKEWTAIQASYFKQCRQCAESIGLSISSRCRLTVPEVLVNACKDTDETDEFTKALRARQAAAFE